MTEFELRLDKIVSPNEDVFVLCNKISEKEYLELLYGLADSELYRVQDNKLRRFLYSGCLKFGRWTAPTPIVVESDRAANFRRFVDGLDIAEQSNRQNIQTMKLFVIKNEIFQHFDSIPLETIQAEQLQIFEQQVKELPKPTIDIKLKEFSRERQNILALISGLKTRNIVTRITTHLPYILHLQPLKINAIWRDISVTATFTPDFVQPDIEKGFNVSGGHPVSPTRWQYGATNVQLDFSALIDFDIQTPMLLALDTMKSPFTAWPKGFTIAFELIHDLAWIIRSNYEGETQWIPSPKDIESAEFLIRSAIHPKIEWKNKGTPGVIIKSFRPSNEVRNIELGHIQSLSWFEKSRLLATMYMETGETNEALFWLNVGVEALFKQRFQEIGLALGKTDFEKELNSPIVYWDSAEQVVSEQYPELKGKIKWPNSESHVGIFKKVKYLCKKATMKYPADQILANYSKVSKHRNALFHGVTEQRIPVEEVKQATDSFDWLVANFMLSSNI